MTGTERVGSLSEEAGRLAEALAGWASDALGGLDSHLATGSAECRVCPLCRLVAAARTSRPEVVEHLADAASSLLAALGTLRAEPGSPPAPARPTAERIDIG